jgi:carboxymethylenebutenolidase
MKHIPQPTNEHVAMDTAAATAALREGDRVKAVFTVGFCYGGANSWRQSAARPGLSGAIGFYGRPERARDAIPDMKAPLLLLVAGADSTPREEFELFDRQLTAAGVSHRMVIYEGAPHSFFDRSFDAHKEACADAWKQIFDFMSENSGVPA